MLGILVAFGAYGSSFITLEGKKTSVNFNDGDTFKILDGELQGKRARIHGLNALESYGPVHEWGKASSSYLYTISQEATQVAQDGHWNCTLEKSHDTYGRLLARCDDLARSLLSMGLAHAYSVDAQPASKNYRSHQTKAQKAEAGMWKYGVPDYILTSLHSADEGAHKTYDRAISTLDGSSRLIKHDKNRTTCEKVCIDMGSSCMVFVPFNQRYGSNKPECLKVREINGYNVRSAKARGKK
jgi:endonuclease YncB( thermonuclease family)